MRPDVPSAVKPERARRRGGFSLIEILVAVSLLALMAGALAPLTVQQIRNSRIRATSERMDVLLRAMVGDEARTEYGYLGEMGGLPPTLDDLNDPAGKPAYVIDPNDGIGYGFGGPYAPGVAPAAAPITDGWTMPFQYNNAVAQLTSSGPDRQLGTADDIVRPPNALPTAGNLIVTIMGIPNNGNPAEQLDSLRASVFYVSSNTGSRSGEVLMAGNGPFNAAGLHLGLHGLRAVGTGTYATATPVREVVAIKRGTNRVTIVIEQ